VCKGRARGATPSRQVGMATSASMRSRLCEFPVDWVGAGDIAAVASILRPHVEQGHGAIRELDVIRGTGVAIVEHGGVDPAGAYACVSYLKWG